MSGTDPVTATDPVTGTDPVAGTVWIVAGPPGAGKSTIAARLAARLDRPAAVLDKDTMFGGFVSAILATANRIEREGPWYDEHIKQYEYAGLANTAAEVRRSACPVVLVAPFTDALQSRDAWAALVRAVGGEPVRLVWVAIDAATLRDRLVARASPRDTAKLASFEAFAARMRPDVPPVVPHIAIDGRADPDAQVSAILARQAAGDAG